MNSVEHLVCGKGERTWESFRLCPEAGHILIRVCYFAHCIWPDYTHPSPLQKGDSQKNTGIHKEALGLHWPWNPHHPKGGTSPAYFRKACASHQCSSVCFFKHVDAFLGGVFNAWLWFQCTAKRLNLRVQPFLPPKSIQSRFAGSCQFFANEGGQNKSKLKVD